MAIVEERMSFDFEDVDKRSMIRILEKFPEHYEIIHFIKNCVKLPGKTVLSTGEVLILAGVIQPYYSFLAERLRNHPTIKQWSGIPQCHQNLFDEA